MIDFLNRNQHMIGAYLSLLFLNFVSFTVSEQTGGIINTYINKGRIQKYFMYISILFSFPIILVLYNRFKKDKNVE